MARPDPLGPTTRCPRGDCCQVCGGARDPQVATYQTPVGVFCATVCRPCMATGTAPPVRSWSQAISRVGAHCQHLGIDVDQMAALLQAERGQAAR